jgi:hypothetical protein
VTFLQAQVDAKSAAAESARAQADDATLEASTARQAADTAAEASAAAAATAATATAAAESERDLVVGDLSGAVATKATLLADAAIAGASVVDVRSTFSAETTDAACALSYEAMGVPSEQGHCEASAASARRRRLTQTSSFDVSVLLSAAQTNQTLIDQGVSNLEAALGASNVVNVVVDPVAALGDIPGVDAAAVATFSTAATAASAASREAATLAAEATSLDEAATTREEQAQTLEANAAALEEDLDTARKILEEATAAVAPPSSAETTDLTLIGAAVGGSVACLLIAFAGYRYRRRLSVSSRGASGPPRFGGSTRRGRFGGMGFGGFNASPTARTDDARRGDDAPFDSEAASRYAPSPAATPPPHPPPAAVPQGTPGQTEDSPTVRGWAEFPPDSPQEEAARAAAAATPSNAHTPPPLGPLAWRSAPIPAPLSMPAPTPPMHTPPAGLAPYATPATDASRYASAAATGPPESRPTPATVVSTPGYSPSAAFAAFGGQDQGATPAQVPPPVSSPPDANASVANDTPTATPASLPSPSIAFAGFAAVGTTPASTTASAAATPEARALNPFLAAASAAVLASSFQTPAAAPRSSVDGFGSTASLADPFGDVSEAESDDPFGDVDGSEPSWSGEDA